jgi:S1-C subfamily serine protease
VQRQIQQNREIANSEVDFRYYYIQKQIKDLEEKLQTEDKLIYNQIDKNYSELNNKQQNSYNKLDEKIVLLPKVEQFKKELLEYKLKQATVMIYNTSIGALGSGVTIKYKGKFYILSAGHMAETNTDALSFWENEQKIGDLEIVKHSFTAPEIEDGDFTKGTDLILLSSKNKTLVPRFYVELADREPTAPTEIYIVGNPAGIEDVLSDGRIIRYMNNFMYYINHTYYGNSGGGVFTRDGRLIGIVSHMFPIGYNYEIPPYMTYGAVRLNEIFEFLKDIE